METTKEIDKELIRKVVKEELESFTIKQEKELRDFSLLERIVRVEDELKAQRDLFMQMFKAMENRFTDVNKRFEAVDNRFEAMDKRFKDLITYMDKRFESMNKRFDDVNKRFESMDKRLDDVNKRFESMDKRFEAIDRRFVQLTWFIGFMTAFISTLITVLKFFM